MNPEELRIIPLGGLGEIGKNMMVLEYGQDILIIDAGIMFPENDMFGVDLVIPDYRYLMDKLDRVKAIVITHGHEDHIGALPFLLQHLRVPIYATKLTMHMFKAKLRSLDAEELDVREIHPGQGIDVGPFEIEFFRVNHSIPDGVGLAIRTPVGLVIHSGDFKFDYTPIIDPPADLSRLALYGSEGVLVLLSDSTNSESSGFTPSERTVQPAFDEVFSRAKGRVIITTFASHLPRIQQAIWSAARCNRKVAIAGRSMEENIRIARQLDYLEIPPKVLSTIGQLRSQPPDRAAILVTGSQGEPSAALGRIAQGTHRQIKIEQGDTVIISAHPIPGNEEEVNEVINRLLHHGAEVLYDRVAPVHVSGHASQEEQRLLVKLIQPRYFVPIHGELRHLHRHARTVQEMGIPPERLLVVENGYTLHFTADGEGRVGERVPGGYVFVDGTGIGDVGPAVLRDREILSRDGFVVISVKVDADTGKLVDEPQITSRGFIFMRQSSSFITEIASLVEGVVAGVEQYPGADELADLLKDQLREMLYVQTRRQPMVVPIVTEV